jgi:hypothetical protein
MAIWIQEEELNGRDENRRTLKGARWAGTGISTIE